MISSQARQPRITVCLFVGAFFTTAIGCSSSSDAGKNGETKNDGSVETSNDGGAEANAPDGSSKTCSVGLTQTRTEGVPCASTVCTKGQSCCLGATEYCADSCPNLELDWVCDSSAHCGTGKTCCFDAPLLDLETCPGKSVSIAPLCENDDGSCRHVACQTDADCSGKTCYAVKAGNTRTIGVCR